MPFEDRLTIEDRLARIEDVVTAILRGQRELRAERAHQAGRWGSRAEAAKHHGRGVDWIDARIADGSIRARKLGPEPEERRDVRGRKIDRRRWEVWIDAGPLSEADVDRLVQEARA